MTRIVGIDPGSRITGYGIIEMEGQRTRHIVSGCIKTGGGQMADRLCVIFQELSDILQTHRPDEMAVEKVFVNRNVDSALKLGQARGAAIVAGVNQTLPVFEFSPTQIKQAITGKGHGSKEQIQHMVKILLSLDHTPQVDAADALAVALCHGHTRQSLERMNSVQGFHGDRSV